MNMEAPNQHKEKRTPKIVERAELLEIGDELVMENDTDRIVRKIDEPTGEIRLILESGSLSILEKDDGPFEIVPRKN